MIVIENSYDQVHHIILQLLGTEKYKSKLRPDPTEKLNFTGKCSVQFNATIDNIFRLCELILKLIFKT